MAGTMTVVPITPQVIPSFPPSDPSPVNIHLDADISNNDDTHQTLTTSDAIPDHQGEPTRIDISHTIDESLESNVTPAPKIEIVKEVRNASDSYAWAFPSVSAHSTAILIKSNTGDVASNVDLEADCHHSTATAGAVPPELQKDANIVDRRAENYSATDQSRTISNTNNLPAPAAANELPAEIQIVVDAVDANTQTDIHPLVSVAARVPTATIPAPATSEELSGAKQIQIDNVDQTTEITTELPTPVVATETDVVDFDIVKASNAESDTTERLDLDTRDETDKPSDSNAKPSEVLDKDRPSQVDPSQEKGEEEIEASGGAHSDELSPVLIIQEVTNTKPTKADEAPASGAESTRTTTTTTTGHTDTRHHTAEWTSLFGGPTSLQDLPDALSEAVPDSGAFIPITSAFNTVEPLTDKFSSSWDDILAQPIVHDSPICGASVDEENSPVYQAPSWANTGAAPGDFEFDFKSFADPDTETSGNMEPETARGAQPDWCDEDAKPGIHHDSFDTDAILTEPPRSEAERKEWRARNGVTAVINLLDNLFPSPQPAEAEVITQELSNDSDDVLNQSNQSEELQWFQVKPSAPDCLCQGKGCKYCEFGLRPRKDDKCVHIGGFVIDNDQSGDYDVDGGRYLSTRKVAEEDLEDDEENNDEPEDYVMSGGLANDTPPLANTIPYNQTDAFVRDTIHIESSSDEKVLNKHKSKGKGKKRAKQPKTSLRPSKKPKITHTSSDSDGKITTISRPKETILQILQRLATPHTTKLCYPITFNSPTCHFCTRSGYAILGTGIRKVKLYDFKKGRGEEEIPDADAVGLANTSTRRPEATCICLAHTVDKMKMFVCRKHTLSAIMPAPSMDYAAAFKRVRRNEPALQADVWCDVCPSPAHYRCITASSHGQGCGIKFCEPCAVRLDSAHKGNLQDMLDGLKDEVSPSYRLGLRADVELLRRGGPVEAFLKRTARGSRTAEEKQKGR